MMTRRLVAVIGLALPLAPCRSARRRLPTMCSSHGAHISRKLAIASRATPAPKGKPFAGGLPMTTPWAGSTRNALQAVHSAQRWFERWWIAPPARERRGRRSFPALL